MKEKVFKFWNEILLSEYCEVENVGWKIYWGKYYVKKKNKIEKGFINGIKCF